ncbi:MAG TPA: D-galactonate dehydratase family protein [Abditibacteriaceae bacterium]|jgi:mannonate dehydratase
MKITHCSALVTCPGRNFVLVKIETDTGLIGWGDATLNGRELAVATYIDEHLAPLLLGEDPLRIEHIWQSLYVGAYWRGGPVQNSALAGIDMALWDIFGKHVHQPVYQLLGGRVREGALAYVHVAGTTPQLVAERVQQRRDQGFKAVRIQLEQSSGSVYGEKPYRSFRETAETESSAQQVQEPAAKTLPLLIQEALPVVGEWEPTPYLRSLPGLFHEVRAAVGDTVELLHDVHHRLSPVQAAGLARELEPFHPFFFEDPVAPEYRDGLALIRQTSAIPIAIGEGFFDVSTCVPLIVNRLLDYLRCDLGHIGGISAARKLATICEPFCIKTAWHGPPDLSPVGHAANVHVDVAVPNFGIQEWYDHTASPGGDKASQVFSGGVTVQDGYLNVPDTPGLGIEIDEAAARQFPYQRAYLPTVRRADGSVHPW